MLLNTEQVARRLDLPESTIERWVRQGRIPVVRRGGSVLFDSRQLREWASAHRLSFNDEERDFKPSSEPAVPSLLGAMQRGGLHYDVPATDVASALAAAVDRAPLSDDLKPEITAHLLERERLSSTGLGDGVAIPHARCPLATLVTEASVTTCILAQPIGFEAVDGQPVRVLFLLLAPSTRVHLQLLSRLTFCLRDAGFVDALKKRPSPQELWELVHGIEAGIDDHLHR